jgi:hypothetical protein
MKSCAGEKEIAVDVVKENTHSTLLHDEWVNNFSRIGGLR